MHHLDLERGLTLLRYSKQCLMVTYLWLREGGPTLLALLVPTYISLRTQSTKVEGANACNETLGDQRKQDSKPPKRPLSIDEGVGFTFIADDG